VTARGAAALAALLLVALAASACGRKGPPVAPEFREPRAVADLAAAVSEGAIELAWRNPDRRVDGTRLRDLVAVHVFRSDDEGEPRPALRTGKRIAGYRPVATVPLAGARDGGTAVVDREDLRYGRRYTYALLAEDAQGRVSPPSLRVTVTYIAPPAAPGGLTAEAGDGEVRLAWQPPAALVTGEPLEGAIAYEILRGAGADGSLVALTPAPLADTTFTDRDLENDRSYAYAVRAIRTEGDATARGAPSPPVTATPVKSTPPSPPRGLSAIPAGRTVRLAWIASPEPDVARYVVYRATGAGALARVGSAEAPATTFLDRDLPPGEYRYAVTAQDATSRANESARSPEVRVVLE
jgi:hypothetical protein